ncbi:MAG TPA: ATP-binding cassette domain-containing protein [Nitrospirae bacterium]|nr:ATP-binding cassette domain-containing protein [Nitrospirota bacterium]
MSYAIKAENIVKSYSIWHDASGRPDSLNDLILGRIKNSVKHRRVVKGGATHEEFLALKDVSFEVARGEKLGIIGRNGAGKTTLLKVLSRITTLSSGCIHIQGRVATLLSVGAGFHAELTGKENIYLNGVILGMTRKEIKRKFDEIVAFSGVEKFIDTPVKRYSSGMTVRLGFAVAAHLDVDILLLDEVLAVGDAEFQNKCLGKVDTMCSEGRTVIFVSHQLDQIKRLCNRCLHMEQGSIINDGTPDEVITAYLAEKAPRQERLFDDDDSKKAQLNRISLKTGDYRLSSLFGPEDEIVVEIEFTVRDLSIGSVHLDTFITLADDTIVWSSDTRDVSEAPGAWPEGRHTLEVRFPARLLNYGSYEIRPVLGVAGKAFDNHPSSIAPGFLGGLKLDIRPSSVSAVDQVSNSRGGFIYPHPAYRIVGG